MGRESGGKGDKSQPLLKPRILSELFPFFCNKPPSMSAFLCCIKAAPLKQVCILFAQIVGLTTQSPLVELKSHECSHHE